MMFVMRTEVRDVYAGGYAAGAATSSPWARAAVRAVVALAARLRAVGVRVSASEELDAVRALASLDVRSRTQVRSALAACLVKDDVHEDAFVRAFDRTFPRQRWQPPTPAASAVGTSGATAPDGSGSADGPDDPTGSLARALLDGDADTIDGLLADAVTRFAGTDEGRSAQHHTQRTLRRMNLHEVYRNVMAALESRRDGDDAGDERSTVERSADAAAAQQALERLHRRVAELVDDRLRDRDGDGGPGDAAPTGEDIEEFPILDAGIEEIAALRTTLRPLVRRLASRLGAQRRRGRGTLDVRRTIRASLQTGGVPVTPHLRRRHPTRPDLVVLLDVSGSTAMFAPFTLALLQAAHAEFARLRSFVFIDGVAEVSEVLAQAHGMIDPRALLDRRGLVAADGRSDYASALRAFTRRWPDAVSTRTTVLVVGDARSHDRPAAEAEVAGIAHAARRLYWFNPEPHHEWDRDDSRQSHYATHCDGVFEVATLRQLTDAVAAIV
jgi:uncharacterized protein with von Willebrand factor type A (vWA) domain